MAFDVQGRCEQCAAAPIDGSNRIRKSWELLTEAEDTPAKYKDLGWRQAMLPTTTGGSGVDTGVTSVGVPNDTGEGRTGVCGPAEAYHTSLLKCWSKLVACSPDLAEAERSGGCVSSGRPIS